jgi:hypothetical protein
MACGLEEFFVDGTEGLKSAWQVVPVVGDQALARVSQRPTSPPFCFPFILTGFRFWSALARCSVLQVCALTRRIDTFSRKLRCLPTRLVRLCWCEILHRLPPSIPPSGAKRGRRRRATMGLETIRRLLSGGFHYPRSSHQGSGSFFPTGLLGNSCSFRFISESNTIRCLLYMVDLRFTSSTFNPKC